VTTIPQNFIYLPNGDVQPVRAPGYRTILNGEHPFNKFVGRDAETGLIRVPAYASREDDAFLRAITRGIIGNIGISSIVDPQLSAIITRRQAMAQTWQFMVEGPDSSREALRRVLSQANDGDGAAAFAADVVGSLDVDNVGAFIAELPIGNIPFEDWEGYGIEARPILNEDGKPKANQYYLTISNEAYRENYGLWSLDGMLCSPTGNRQWPFWFTPLDKRTGKPGKVQVLIPGDVGFQVIQRVGGRSWPYEGFGQSGSWRYTAVMVKDCLIGESEIEAFMDRPPEGFVVFRAVDRPGQGEEAVRQTREANEEKGKLFDPGVTYLEFTNDKGDVLIRPWTQPPAYFTPQNWRTYREDVLAACFHVSVAFLVTRIGTGAFSQSDVTAEIQAETGLAWIRHVMEQIFTSLGSPRTRVIVNIPSDKARRAQIETGAKFAETIKALQEAGAGFTAGQIQMMYQEQVGFEVPEVEEGDEPIAPPTPIEKQKEVSQSANGEVELAVNGHG
jgi:hypothetical protein